MLATPVQKILLILIWLVGLGALIFSFFFNEKTDFSPSQVSEEQIYKNTSFTKLTKRLKNVYFFLLLLFFALLFFYNYIAL